MLTRCNRICWSTGSNWIYWSTRSNRICWSTRCNRFYRRTGSYGHWLYWRTRGRWGQSDWCARHWWYDRCHVRSTLFQSNEHRWRQFLYRYLRSSDISSRRGLELTREHEQPPSSCIWIRLLDSHSRPNRYKQEPERHSVHPMLLRTINI
jgi:hypothetical protein